MGDVSAGSCFSVTTAGPKPTAKGDTGGQEGGREVRTLGPWEQLSAQRTSLRERTLPLPSRPALGRLRRLSQAHPAPASASVSSSGEGEFGGANQTSRGRRGPGSQMPQTQCEGLRGTDITGLAAPRPQPQGSTAQRLPPPSPLGPAQHPNEDRRRTQGPSRLLLTPARSSDWAPAPMLARGPGCRGELGGGLQL